MKQTFREVIQYISDQSEYMVIGSFALHCFRSFPYSDDFDVSLYSKKTIREWTKHFRAHGWKQTREFETQEKNTPIVTLEKDGTTLDLIYDPIIFQKYPAVTVTIARKKIHVISPEGSFLRKLSGAFQHPERGKKRAWDFYGAMCLRNVVDEKKALKLFKKIYLTRPTKPLAQGNKIT
ncbi:MAG: hypothetical protein V1778_00895 [bacterium]